MNKLIFCLALLLAIQCPILLVAQDELVPPAGVTKAVEFFDQQPETKRTTASMAIRYRGNFGGIKNNGLCGWVTDTQTNAPINLRIAVNGVVLKTVTADRKRPDIVRNGIDTDGHCGFHVPLDQLGVIQHRDSISITTDDGAFELPNSPLVMAA